MTDLCARLAQPAPVVAPGVFDALSALVATEQGAEALYLSGASIAYTQLGRSDLGFTGLSDVANVTARISDRVDTPIIVDADTGFGNAVNVSHSVRVLERAGAQVIQLEDQALPKRCGHLSGKQLVSSAEMVGKVHAALDSRNQALILARTDAVSVEGLTAALDRAEAMLEAGADAIFVEGVKTEADLAKVGSQLGGRVPLLANMVEGGQTPILPAPKLAELGFSIVIFPGGMARRAVHAMREFYGAIFEHGTTQSLWPEMANFDELNRLIGTPELMELGAKYAPQNEVEKQ